MYVKLTGLAVVLAISAALTAQEVENKAAKPTPAEKARMLLDSAAEMVAAARAEVQVAALMHLGDNFEEIDKKRALKFYRQAFAAAASVDDASNKADLQAQVTGRMARLNVTEAIGMLKMMAASDENYSGFRRHDALYRIAQQLAKAGDFDQAIAFTEMVATTGPFPLGVLNLLLNGLPPGDYRCGALFATAVSAFRAKPQVEFGDTISQQWHKLPPQAVDSAVKAMVDWVLERKDKEGEFNATLSSEKGTANFASQQDYDLFNLVHILQQFDPKRAEDMLMRRPALRVMIERFPEGRDSMGNNLSSSTNSGNRSADNQARTQLEGLANSRAEVALAALNEDPQKALDAVASIPLPERQAEVLGQIAASLGEQDPEKVRSVLNRASKLLSDVKEPAPRIQPWLHMAKAAHGIKDDQAAWGYLGRAMDDVVALYKRDTDEKAGNQAIREEWPSTQAGRRVVASATAMFSVDAEPFLVKIADPEIALLARIEMAQILLGLPPTQGSTSFMRRTKQ